MPDFARLFEDRVSANPDAETYRLFGRTVDYVPGPKYREFWRRADEMWGPGDVLVLQILGGNGIGKTAHCANLIENLMSEPMNPFFAGLRCLRGIRQGTLESGGAIHCRFASTRANITGAVDPDTGETIPGGGIHTEIKKWFPSEGTRGMKAGKGWVSQYVSGGSFLSIMSYNQDREEYESVTLVAAVFDEPPPELIFDATLARMRARGGGIVLIIATPLNLQPWMEYRLLGKGRPLDIEGEGKRGKYLETLIDMDDELEEVGGHLTRQEMENMLAKMRPEERVARKTGRFMHLSGRVWKDWDPQVHMKPVETFSILSSWSRVMVLDPHNARPWAMAWYALSNRGVYYWHDEWPNYWEADELGQWDRGALFHDIKGDKRGIDDYVRLIRARERNHEGQPSLRVIDPNYGLTQFRESKGARTTIEALAKRGLVFTEGYDDSTTGRAQVNDYMRVRRTSGGKAWSQIQVSDRCHNLIFQIQNVQFMPLRTTAQREDKAASEVVQEKFKDFGYDIVIYGLTARVPIGLSPETEQRERDDRDYGRDPRFNWNATPGLRELRERYDDAVRLVEDQLTVEL